jgi:hypothetical protein
MSITQDRMIRLIQDAKSYEQGYHQLKQLLADWAKAELAAGRLDQGSWLSLETQMNFIKQPTGRWIAIEDYHYKKFAKRNLREAQRQRHKRMGLQGPEAQARAKDDGTRPGGFATYPVATRSLDDIAREMNVHDQKDQFSLDDLDIGPPISEAEFREQNAGAFDEAEMQRQIDVLRNVGAIHG